MCEFCAPNCRAFIDFDLNVCARALVRQYNGSLFGVYSRFDSNQCEHKLNSQTNRNVDTKITLHFAREIVKWSIISIILYLIFLYVCVFCFKLFIVLFCLFSHNFTDLCLFCNCFFLLVKTVPFVFKYGNATHSS